MAFAAKYGGACGSCGERIKPGQVVEYVDDELVHIDCAGATPTERKPAEVCTVCWLEKPCGCGEF